MNINIATKYIRILKFSSRNTLFIGKKRAYSFKFHMSLISATIHTCMTIIISITSEFA